MTSGLRSTIDGMMKSQSCGRSATLTQAPAPFAAAQASAARRSSSTATKQSAVSWKSLGSGSRASWRKLGASRSSRKSSVSAAANVVTLAPALMRCSARRAAAAPPPTTTAALPLSSRKIGKWRMAIGRRRSLRAVTPGAAGPAKKTSNSPGALLNASGSRSKENRNPGLKAGVSTVLERRAFGLNWSGRPDWGDSCSAPAGDGKRHGSAVRSLSRRNEQPSRAAFP